MGYSMFKFNEGRVFITLFRLDLVSSPLIGLAIFIGFGLYLCQSAKVNQKRYFDPFFGCQQIILGLQRAYILE